MSLRDQLGVDLVLAMKAKDEARVSTLRLLVTAIKNAEIEKRGKGGDVAITDEDILTVIGKQIKQRRDAAEQFRLGGREELAAKEDAEQAILESYLPAQLSDEELAKVVKAAIAETGASGPKDMGRVMVAVSPKTKGRADGSRVSALVKKLLVN